MRATLAFLWACTIDRKQFNDRDSQTAQVPKDLQISEPGYHPTDDFADSVMAHRVVMHMQLTNNSADKLCDFGAISSIENSYGRRPKVKDTTTRAPFSSTR